MIQHDIYTITFDAHNLNCQVSMDRSFAAWGINIVNHPRLGYMIGIYWVYPIDCPFGMIHS